MCVSCVVEPPKLDSVTAKGINVTVRVLAVVVRTKPNNAVHFRHCSAFAVGFNQRDSMNYFATRYEAIKAFPNAIVRKILNYHVNANAGQYVVFNDCSTYEDWKRCGHVR